jgi:hypothetical protein
VGDVRKPRTTQWSAALSTRAAAGLGDDDERGQMALASLRDEVSRARACDRWRSMQQCAQCGPGLAGGGTGQTPTGPRAPRRRAAWRASCARSRRRPRSPAGRRCRPRPRAPRRSRPPPRRSCTTRSCCGCARGAAERRRMNSASYGCRPWAARRSVLRGMRRSPRGACGRRHGGRSVVTVGAAFVLRFRAHMWAQG